MATTIVYNVYNPSGAINIMTTLPGRPNDEIKFAIKPPAIKLKKSKRPDRTPAKPWLAETTHSIGEPVLFSGAVELRISSEVLGVVVSVIVCWFTGERKALPGNEPV